MAVRFANSYIDRVFTDKDLGAIYNLIDVVGRDRSLPEEFWLFCRIYEWAPSRSGVWQYYESLPDAKFERISQAMDRFGLAEIAEKYRVGRDTWNAPGLAADLDKWLDTHALQIHTAIFDLISTRKDCLRNQG
jgi:hypothetical protein